MRKHIPGNMTIQTVSIGFKYTGQPPQWFKCSSLEHMIKDCPLKRTKTPQTDNTGNNAATTTETLTETAPTTSPETHTETPKTQETTPDDQPRGGYKRPPPSTDSEDSESEIPAEKIKMATTPHFQKEKRKTKTPRSTAKGTLTTSHETFERHRGTRQRTGYSHEHHPWRPESTRGLYIQHKLSHYSDAKKQKHSMNKPKEIQAWKSKHGMITQDAFAELLTLINAFKKNTPL